MAFDKGGTAKDLHYKPVAFQGLQAFFTQIDKAESSEAIGAILDKYTKERGQLEMPLNDVVETEKRDPKNEQKAYTGKNRYQLVRKLSLERKIIPFRVVCFSIISVFKDRSNT